MSEALLKRIVAEADPPRLLQFFIAVVPACVLFMGFSIFMANNLTVVLTTPRLYVDFLVSL